MPPRSARRLRPGRGSAHPRRGADRYRAHRHFLRTLADADRPRCGDACKGPGRRRPARQAPGPRHGGGSVSLVADGSAPAVRGEGLVLGLEAAAPIAREVVTAARARHGLLVNATGDTTLRLVPPLIISSDEVATALELLTAALADA